MRKKVINTYFSLSTKNSKKGHLNSFQISGGGYGAWQKRGGADTPIHTMCISVR